MRLPQAISKSKSHDMANDPHKPNRKSLRLKGYDYGREGLYFVTLKTWDNSHLFGEIRDGKMHPNKFGRIVNEEWTKSVEIRGNVELHEYVLMPNHFHAIVEILFSKNPDPEGPAKFKSPSHTLGAIIRGFKGAVTKQIREIYFGDSEDSAGSGSGRMVSAGMGSGRMQFAPTIRKDKSIWQRDYNDIIIRNERAYRNISNYIRANPANW